MIEKSKEADTGNGPDENELGKYQATVEEHTIKPLENQQKAKRTPFRKIGPKMKPKNKLKETEYAKSRRPSNLCKQ